MGEAGQSPIREQTDRASDDFPDALIVTTAAGRILSWNTGASALFGFTVEEAVGRSLFALTIPAERSSETQAWLESAAKSGFAVCVSARRRKDGSGLYVDGSARAAPDAEHGVVLVLIERDLSSSGHRESPAVPVPEGAAFDSALDALLRAIPDALVIVNGAGSIVEVNALAEQLFGYARDQLVGQAVEILVPLDRWSAHERERAEYMRAPCVRKMGSGVHLRARRSDGVEFPVDVSLGPVPGVDGGLVIAVVRDLTERVRLEEARRVLQERRELELRVAERTRELQATQDALRAANRELEAFTYSVSHDLRAPIRRIKGFSRILADEFGPELKPPAQHCVDRIQDSVQHMAQLVDDLLHLARVTRRELRPRVVPVDALVREVLLSLAADIGDRNIEWRLQRLPTLECDAGLVKVAFTNLLGNAIKYTRSRERAVIEVGHIADDGTPVLYVRDNGVGFEMKFAEQLFGVFQRLHGGDEFEGTGVGLATVQRIVHKHGGEIWAESEPDRGASFFFTLGHRTLQGRAATGIPTRDRL